MFIIYTHIHITSYVYVYPSIVDEGIQPGNRHPSTILEAELQVQNDNNGESVWKAHHVLGTK